jgi:fluoride exporter
MVNVLLICIGGFCGAISRFAVSGWSKKHFPSLFPYGTLFVNVLGSFLLGIIVGADIESGWKLLFGVGFMGSFTTFSTFKVEIIALIEKKCWKIVSFYIGASYAGGLLFAFFGYYFTNVLR